MCGFGGFFVSFFCFLLLFFVNISGATVLVDKDSMEGPLQLSLISALPVSHKFTLHNLLTFITRSQLPHLYILTLQKRQLPMSANPAYPSGSSSSVISFTKAPTPSIFPTSSSFLKFKIGTFSYPNFYQLPRSLASNSILQSSNVFLNTFANQC